MYHMKSILDIEKILNTNSKLGLSEKEANTRLSKYGKNKLDEAKHDSIFVKFIKQFKDFMIIILLISSVISFVTAYIENTGDYIDSVIIILVVVFNALMGVIQEAKAEKSIDALKNMFSPTTKVKRDGKIKSINSEDVVLGDVIILETGSFVPADARVISTSNLSIDESALTGETNGVTKENCILNKEKVSTSDMKNMVFSSTVIVSGHGEAIVTNTGMNTRVGKIANMLINTQNEDTPLQKKLDNVGKILGVAALIICAAIFVIGILKNTPPLEMFMTSVGLAVASIPEGLPAIVTILLSIGISKMAKKNAIIRKLPAVETLGSSSVICSDKTGTLTQNKMTVTKVYGEEKLLTEYMCMCTDCTISNKVVTGKPTEKALVEYALTKNISKDTLYLKYPRVLDIPFDSKRKLMTTIHKAGGKYLVITKGAPDVLLSKCKDIVIKGTLTPLSTSKQSEIIKENETMANKALRVIAVGFKYLDNLPSRNLDIENNLTFVGLAGMIDPPRVGVKEAILKAKNAGIKTVMITGDHILTAKAIAKDLGILNGSEIAITGQELDNISDKELEKNIMKYSVFARVSPEHKVRIVKAFKKLNKTVAMTGDGVNDAPALKTADIGVAMGLSGTDVAKNASDMILTDDNFVTIIEAVKEGRHIYDNIKKAVHFLIATNVGEIVTMLFALLLGLDTPLLAIHLLWINLVTDSFPAIALGLQKCDKGIMEKEPVDSNKSIFYGGLWGKIFTEGLMIGILNLTVFCIFLTKYDLQTARTGAFVSLGLIELVHSFNIKSEGSILTNILDNKYLILSFIVGCILQISVVIYSPIAKVFDVVTLNSSQWQVICIVSLLPILFMEIQKVILNLTSKKTMSIKSFSKR